MEEIVEIGEIDPDQVHTPSIFVDYLVKAERGARMIEYVENKEIIAQRIARIFKTGDVVNLGIGLPTLVANYVPDGGHRHPPVARTASWAWGPRRRRARRTRT
ncbi:MAG: hypothetical protein MZU97_12625 [Bacillus subtilis]|nr:hypothetical protein [Bacillus subtilis]